MRIANYANILKGSGFTLIELLVVVAIFVILAAASVPVYGNWQSSAQMDTAVSEIVQGLRLAKTKSAAGFNNSVHGIYFEINAAGSDRFIIYQGSSYASRDTDHDQETELSGALSLATTLTGNEIGFSKGLGEPTTTGTVTILHSGSSESVMISINGLGVVDVD